MEKISAMRQRQRVTSVTSSCGNISYIKRTSSIGNNVSFLSLPLYLSPHRFEDKIVKGGSIFFFCLFLSLWGRMQALKVWEDVRTTVLDATYAEQAVSARDLVAGVAGRPFLLEPALPLVGVCGYLLVKDLLKRVCTAFGTTGKSRAFKRFALIHNILICIFSLWTSINVWSLTFRHMMKFGVQHVYCEDTLWKDGMAFWGMLFYLSKYWELVDTMLLIWKQRAPSFLQVYHHAVTIICAYTLQASHSQVMFLFVGLNATVHTIMYAYYALTVLGYRVKGKSMITIMQMAQFGIGTAAALPTFLLRNGQCTCASQKIAVGGIIVHAVVLTTLFYHFYSVTYTKSNKSKGPKHA